MSKNPEQPSFADTVGTILFFLIGGIVVAMMMNSCTNDEETDRAEPDLVEQSLAEAKAARGKLPADYDSLSTDPYILMAHNCAVIMKNRLESDNWFDWTNSANDIAPTSLLDRAEALGVDVSNYKIETFFQNALSEIPRLSSLAAPNEGAEFFFYVTTTSDTFGGLKMVLRKYSCYIFPSGNVRFREDDAQLY